MPDPNESYPHKVVLLGSLPPLGALSSYCLELSLSISNMIDVEFISFQKIYPSFLYPGGNMKGDYTFPNIHHPKIHRVNNGSQALGIDFDNSWGIQLGMWSL